MPDTIRIGDLTVLAPPSGDDSRTPVLFVRHLRRRPGGPWLRSSRARSRVRHRSARSGSRIGSDLGNVSVDDYVDDAAEIAR